MIHLTTARRNRLIFLIQNKPNLKLVAHGHQVVEKAKFDWKEAVGVAVGIIFLAAVYLTSVS